MKQYKHIVDQVLADEGRLIWLFWLSPLISYPIYSFSYQPIGESFIHKRPSFDSDKAAQPEAANL